MKPGLFGLPDRVARTIEALGAVKAYGSPVWLAMPMFCSFRLVRETQNVQSNIRSTLREVQGGALATSKQLHTDT